MVIISSAELFPGIVLAGDWQKGVYSFVFKLCQASWVLGFHYSEVGLWLTQDLHEYLSSSVLKNKPRSSFALIQNVLAVRM